MPLRCLTTPTPHVSHTFRTEGLYLVELRVQSLNYSTTQSLVVDIHNVKPMAWVEKAFGQTIEVGVPLKLNASASLDSSSDLGSLRFIWDFGDEDSFSGYSSVLSHVYYASGVYQGLLTLLDDNAANATCEFVVWVRNPAPHVEIASQIHLEEGKTTLLKAQVTDTAFQMLYLEYEWQIDDNYVSHEYITLMLDDGSYQGYLTVTDMEGQNTTINFQLLVKNQLPRVISTPHIIYGRKPAAFRVFASSLDIFLDSELLLFRYAITNTLSSPSELLENQGWLPVTDGKIILDLDFSTLPHGQHTLIFQAKDPTNVGPPHQQPLVVYWDEDGDSFSDILEAQMGTDETIADTDDDWIVDSQEEHYGTDPSLSDTDNDGLWDGYQASIGVGEFLVNTDPTNPDTDGDSLLDGIEVFGWDITVLMQGSSTSYTEIHVYSNPRLGDTDNDGVTDAEEYTLKSNPQISDTDGDGLTDLEEKTIGTPITAAYSPITTLDTSLSIDSKAPGESAPWTVEITLAEAFKKDPLMQLDRDEDNELVPTSFTVNIYYRYWIWIFHFDVKIGECDLDEFGKGQFTYDTYRSNIVVKFAGNNLYEPISRICYPNYHVDKMIQNVGPEDSPNNYYTSDPFTNAKLKIYRAYIEDSGAFSKSGDTYTMTSDMAHTWPDRPPLSTGPVIRGYKLLDPLTFTTEELESGKFDPEFITLRHYHGNFIWKGIPPVPHPNQKHTDYEYPKQTVLDLWLSMKIQPWQTEQSPSPDNIVKRINGLASDLVTLLTYDRNDYKAYQEEDWFQDFVTSVYGRLELLTQTGFPDDQGFFESFIKWLQGLIDEFISLIQGIIEFLVGLAVSAVNFLFAVWDELVKPALGSVVELVKEVAVTTVKLVLTIMTHALTVDNPYKNTAKQKFLNTFETTDWSLAFQGLENGLSSINLAGVTEPLATNVATTLGPSDSFLEVLAIYQRALDLPGIIKDLQNLIGPNLVVTLVSQLLKETIAVLFKAIIESWGDLEIQDFIQFDLLLLWLQTNAVSLIGPTTSPDLNWEGIKTFSDLIRVILSFLELVKFSMWIKFLSTITNIFILALQAKKFVFNAFLDMVSLVVGGFMYLLNPAMSEPLTDIIFFWGMSLASRLFSLAAEWMVTNIDKALTTLLSMFCAQINWAYIGGWPLAELNIPGAYFLNKYGSRWNYLGANVLSHYLNQLGALIGALAPFNDFKAIFLPLIVGKISYKHFTILVSRGLSVLAGVITGAAILLPQLEPIFGNENLPNHWHNKDIVWQGDLMFLTQASFFHIFININKAWKDWHEEDEGIIDWTNIQQVNTVSKRSLVFLAINMILDAGMGLLFLFNV
ncbi:MAG: PKD domain-containing protein [Candidatus Hermodarchaeota archaeon]